MNDQPELNAATAAPAMPALLVPGGSCSALCRTRSVADAQASATEVAIDTEPYSKPDSSTNHSDRSPQ